MWVSVLGSKWRVGGLQTVCPGLWELCPVGIVVPDPGRGGERDRKKGVHLLGVL